MGIADVNVHRFSLHDVPARPWKNHGGTTRELVSSPPGADLDTFAWRASVATISADGPFSQFPGVDRTIVLLSGDGLRLRGTSTNHQLDARGAPFRFDGASRLHCSLIAGPCTVLNIMTRRDLGATHLDVATAPTTISATDGMVLIVLGDWQLGGDSISAGSGLWWRGAPPQQRLQPTGGSGQLVLVRWEPR